MKQVVGGGFGQTRKGGRGLTERERWMNPIILLFSFTALNLSQSREQKKKENNRNVSNDGGR